MTAPIALGDRVKCVNDMRTLMPVSPLVRNAIYVVAGVFVRNGIPTLYLREVAAPPPFDGFEASLFKAVSRPKHGAFSDLLQSTKVRP